MSLQEKSTMRFSSFGSGQVHIVLLYWAHGLYRRTVTVGSAKQLYTSSCAKRR